MPVPGQAPGPCSKITTADAATKADEAAWVQTSTGAGGRGGGRGRTGGRGGGRFPRPNAMVHGGWQEGRGSAIGPQYTDRKFNNSYFIENIKEELDGECMRSHGQRHGFGCSMHRELASISRAATVPILSRHVCFFG